LGFKDKRLNSNQTRLLVMAKQQGGRFSSAQYQKLAEIDIYSASQDIKDLIRKDIVRLEHKGGRIYVFTEGPKSELPQDFQSLAQELAEKRQLSNEDLRRIWGADRQTALRRARKLIDAGWLEAQGGGRGRRYAAGPKAG
jgi:Fic family protein